MLKTIQKIICLICLLSGLVLSGNKHANAQAVEVLRLGSNRELFVDGYLIDKLNNVQQMLHHPHSEGTVLKFDNPWEGNFSGYCTIIKDGNQFKLYYRGIREAGKDGNDNEVTCYAESSDGVNWIKPDLGIYTINGTRNNNVILAHAAPATHNFTPFLDANPEAKAGERFKAVGGTEKTATENPCWQNKQIPKPSVHNLHQQKQS